MKTYQKDKGDRKTSYGRFSGGIHDARAVSYFVCPHHQGKAGAGAEGEGGDAGTAVPDTGEYIGPTKLIKYPAGCAE